jgi:glycosyltransferase involved in cell wall biosynthesis
MSSPPLVSVVLPFLDAEVFLDESVRSVIDQTHANWELLLVDDGSTDRSGQIAAGWAERDSRIRVLHHEGHENRGISASRNLGLKYASGEFVALLDADDLFLPNKLERQIGHFAHWPEAGMVYGRTLYWFGWSGKPEDAARDWIQPHGVPADQLLFPPGTLAGYLNGTIHMPCVCGVLVRRDVATAVGGFEDRFRGMYEDQVFFSKVAVGYPVLPSDECLDQYRQHPESVCSTNDQVVDRLGTRRDFLDWLRGLLVEVDCTDARVWDALRQEAWLARERSRTPVGLQDRARWLERWMLRGESLLLPGGLRHRLWSRRAPGWSRAPGTS